MSFGYQRGLTNGRSQRLPAAGAGLCRHLADKLNGADGPLRLGWTCAPQVPAPTDPSGELVCGVSACCWPHPGRLWSSVLSSLTSSSPEDSFAVHVQRAEQARSGDALIDKLSSQSLGSVSLVHQETWVTSHSLAYLLQDTAPICKNRREAMTVVRSQIQRQEPSLRVCSSSSCMLSCTR